jgi:hypothetical protein
MHYWKCTVILFLSITAAESFHSQRSKSAVKCSSDKECQLLSAALTCHNQKCAVNCPENCDYVSACKNEKQCWKLGPSYTCHQDGICVKRPEEELAEGNFGVDIQYSNTVYQQVFNLQNISTYYSREVNEKYCWVF